LAGILPPLSYPAAGKRDIQTAIDVHSNCEELLPSHRDLDGRLIVAQTSLAELTAAAAAVDEPGFTPATVPRLGGVDPLGLRQINFDLMDQVFPGLNNVARHIRPFVVVAWAWRRANQLAQGQGIDKIPLDHLQDFVDRIEVIYVWSQFLRTPEADLPGRLVLANLLQADKWTFGGAAWQQRRTIRRYSTALTAPINYGPALKMLGWVKPHPKYPNILIATPAAVPALDAFEAQITEFLGHPAFSKFGSVTVTAEEARGWSGAWALDSVTKAEADAMTEMLLGSDAPVCRQMGGELMLAAATHASTIEVDPLRSTMAGPPSDFMPPAHLLNIWEAWRRIEVRQLFRLSLEALLYWTIATLEEKPKGTDALVDVFLGQVSPPPNYANAREWLSASLPSATGPTELMKRIEQALNAPSALDLAPSIIAALSFCLAESPPQESHFERVDRLPLFRARREASVRAEGTSKDFVRHVFESWVLAQHVYWSVGRGLADARAQGKTLLRLKVMLDEAGWTLAPGASRGSPPQPTPDRLQTLVSLARECGLLNSPGAKDLPAVR
jgi:hypothetical protein